MSLHTHTRTHMHTFAHTHTHILTHTHTHTHTLQVYVSVFMCTPDSPDAWSNFPDLPDCKPSAQTVNGFETLSESVIILVYRLRSGTPSTNGKGKACTSMGKALTSSHTNSWEGEFSSQFFKDTFNKMFSDRNIKIVQKFNKQVRCGISLLIRLNRFFHLGKNRNRFFAIYCDLLRFIAIYCDFFLGNQIRHREKIEEDCKDLLPAWFPF